jgi:hypothetical protein
MTVFLHFETVAAYRWRKTCHWRKPLRNQKRLKHLQNGGPLSPLDDRNWHAHDEQLALDALRCDRPGWIWLVYMALGVAFWTGVGVGISALIGAL